MRFNIDQQFLTEKREGKFWNFSKDWERQKFNYIIEEYLPISVGFFSSSLPYFLAMNNMLMEYLVDQYVYYQANETLRLSTSLNH